MSSYAGSEGFGRFLDDEEQNEAQQKAIDLEQRRQRPRPTSGNPNRPQRVQTARPFQIPLNRPSVPSKNNGVRVFSRSEVRGMVPPRPPSSVLSDQSQPDHEGFSEAMQWRLRTLGKFAPSLHSQIPSIRYDADSDKFSLGSSKASKSIMDSRMDGTTTGMRRALDSRFVRSKKIRKEEDVDLDFSDSLSANLNSMKEGQGLQREDHLGHKDISPRRIETAETAKLPIPASQSQLNLNNVDIGDDFAFNNDNDAISNDANEMNDAGSTSSSRLPSRLSSDSNADLFVRPQHDNGVADHRDEEIEVDEGGDQGTTRLDADVIHPRPRDPHEIEAPLIFEVPVEEMPNIDWGADDIDVDGEFLQQQLEHSESESEDESDAGSVAEIIDDDSDEDSSYAENDNNKDYIPPPTQAAEEAGSDSESESDSEGRVEALTESEDENGNAQLDLDIETIESLNASRQARPKRNRIPTVKYWLGERIEYETDVKNELMTAVEVRRVEPPQKSYRRRRQYRRRSNRHQFPIDDEEADADQQDVQVPVFDTKSREWRDRTVARSITGLEFDPVEAEDGSRLPLVSRCILFGGKHDSAILRLCVLRIEPGGMFSYTSEQNKASTFVVWRGKCTVHLNNHEFELAKGMACSVPRGNDFFVDNGSTDRLSTGDVYLFVTEINAAANPELADALTRDAQSMISGAAAITNYFENSSEPDINQNASVSPSEGYSGGGDDNAASIGSLGAIDHNDDEYNMGQLNEDTSFGAVNFNDNSNTDTFLPGFARALRSNSEKSGISPTVPANRPIRHPVATNVRHIPPPNSVDSLSMALHSDSDRRTNPAVVRDTNLAVAGIPIVSREDAGEPSRLRPSRATVRPLSQPVIAEEPDSLDTLSDYLEGRKGTGRRNLVLPERPVTDVTEQRIRTYLKLMEEHSDISR